MLGCVPAGDESAARLRESNRREQLYREPGERFGGPEGLMTPVANIPRWVGRLVPLLVLIAGLGVRLLNPPFLEGMQLGAFDLFQRLHPRVYQDVPVRIIDVDDESLRRLGQWPWPRTQVAELVTRLAHLGAVVVALDIVFAEPDRTSPAQVLPLWPVTAETDQLRARIATLPDHDQILARAMANARVVTGFSLTVEPTDARPLSKAGFAYAGDDPLQYIDALAGAVGNLPQLEMAASGNGHFTLIAERDGIIRRIPLVLRIGETIYPALVAETLRLAQGASAYVIKSSGGSGELSFGARTGIANIKIGTTLVPTDARGRVWLYLSPPAASRTISAWKILSGAVNSSAIDGAVVFIGTSATGLKDLRATPLDPVSPGVEVHAQLAEQILLRQFLHYLSFGKLQNYHLGAISAPETQRYDAGKAA